MIEFSIQEKAALSAAYIPLFADGGLFIPTTHAYRLGDDVILLLSLPDDAQRYPVAGKVAWITPSKAQGERSQGIGIQFPTGEKSRWMKRRIEDILGTSLATGRPTQTF